ncbi:MAG: (2Fe-2S) ferredoxin domain-containing protein [Firmicutes bacterium]|jgi:NADP-reducing hydrogenase subunit HndB|nr:(2Fe-2S) ferredoxin domain-containing protein [Bacillota bacterium]
MAMTLDKLKEIREKMQADLNQRDNSEGKIRVLVGMATCGIASGARPVLRTLSEDVQEKNMTDKIMVTQTGCIGLCQYEPIVEVVEPGKPKVTYIYMNPDKAQEVFNRHLVGGHVVREYTLESSNLK